MTGLLFAIVALTTIAATEKSCRKWIVCVSLVAALMLVFSTPRPMQGQDNKDPYPTMVPLEQYLMDRDAEIALARSAGPASIARDATIMVFSRHGFETAVQGKNGFVCMADRGWMLPFDKPDFWNPKVRLPLCMNAPGARFHLPLAFRMTEWALGGMTREQMSARLKAAYDSRTLPLPENGAMCYMMSKQQNFGDKEGNGNDSHMMFWFPQGEHTDWGADADDSPVNVHQYSPQPITEFTISTSKWSDGTPVAINQARGSLPGATPAHRLSALKSSEGTLNRSIAMRFALQVEPEHGVPVSAWHRLFGSLGRAETYRPRASSPTLSTTRKASSGPFDSGLFAGEQTSLRVTTDRLTARSRLPPPSAPPEMLPAGYLLSRSASCASCPLFASRAACACA